MFEHQLVQKAQQNPECMEFVDLFARFQADIKKFNALPLNASIRPQERSRMIKFEMKIDNAWKLIPEDERRVIVENMLFKKLLPEEVKTALRVFGGKVVLVV